MIIEECKDVLKLKKLKETIASQIKRVEEKGEKSQLTLDELRQEKQKIEMQLLTLELSEL